MQKRGLKGMYSTAVMERLISSFENSFTKGMVLPVYDPKDDLALWVSVSSSVTTKAASCGVFQVLAFWNHECELSSPFPVFFFLFSLFSQP